MRMCGTWAVMRFTLPEWFSDFMSTSTLRARETFHKPSRE
jgi:hypothetical protein